MREAVRRRLVIRHRGTMPRAAERPERVKPEIPEACPLEHWRGSEVVCIASGPSLTQADVELVKAWRYDMAWRRVIVTNNTWKIAPWADAMFAMDLPWWQTYHSEVERGYKGLRFTQHSQGDRYGALNLRKRVRGYRNYKNTGACAVAAAIHLGATRVVMLGYDGCKVAGKAHWHDDHPKGLGNAGSVKRWPKDLDLVKDLALRTRGLKVVNASRNSVFRHFERQELEQALAWTAAT